MGECVERFTADNPFNIEWKFLNGPGARPVFKNKLLLYIKNM
jgi:hypothetical protein